MRNLEIYGNMKYFHNLHDPGKTVPSFIRAAINTDSPVDLKDNKDTSEHSFWRLDLDTVGVSKLGMQKDA